MPTSNRRVPLSVLELAPRSQGMTPRDALAASTQLAQEVAQKLTITTLPRRFWVLTLSPAMLMKVTSGAFSAVASVA